MLRAIDRNLWVAEQPLKYFGLSVGTRMTMIRLAGGGLIAISPIQPSDLLVSQLNELGQVEHIIAPNLYHYMFAADFKAVYPTATFWSTSKLRAKQPELAIDQAIDDSSSSPWPGLERLFFEGFKTLGPSGPDRLDEWVFYHTDSRTLILTDTAFWFDESFPWLTQLAAKLGSSYKSLSPSRLEWLATTDKAKVKAAAQKVLDWDFGRVIMAHGSIVEQDGKAQFTQGYGQFLGCSLLS
jgi:hypothetical protein